MKTVILKVSELVSYFDKENQKGGIMANPKCIKRLHIRIDRIALALDYKPN